MVHIIFISVLITVNYCKSILLFSSLSSYINVGLDFKYILLLHMTCIYTHYCTNVTISVSKHYHELATQCTASIVHFHGASSVWVSPTCQFFPYILHNCCVV